MKPPRDRQAPGSLESLFYADRTMMCPDDGAVDHVGASIPLKQFGQSFQHCFEHTGLDPASISAEDAVPLAVFIRQMPPLRTRSRHPHHAFEIAPIVMSRTAPASLLGREKRTDYHPFIVRQIDPFAQGYLEKKALNQKPIPQSTFVHER